MKLAVVVVALAITGCKKKSIDHFDSQAEPPKAEAARIEAPKADPVPLAPAEPAEPALPKSDPGATVEKLLDDVRPMLTTQGAVIREFEASYVRRDGTLDPTYGWLRIDTVTSVDAVDDPNRPIGAPTKATATVVERTQCPTLKFTHGVWTRLLHSCAHGEAVSLRCTVSEIWEHAIRDKQAPPGALAVIERDDSPDAWFFSIEDEPRKIHLKTSYHDDVCPK